MSKYREQLAAWAIDRAIETTKQNPNTGVDAAVVLAIATAYCDWIKEVAIQETEEPELQVQ